MDQAPEYNYASFVEEQFEPWLNFANSPALGAAAPDFTLTTLDGEQVRLAEHWRKHAYTIIEFGSLT